MKIYKGKILRNFLISGIGISLVFGISSCQESSIPKDLSFEAEQSIRPLEGVAALGQLSPLGDIRKLAAPLSGFGGTPRVANLLVNEGDSVKKGQVLAVFDNRPQIIADIRRLTARKNTLEIEIRMQERTINRYKQAAIEGATSLVSLEVKEDQLIKLDGQREETIAELIRLEADLENSELKTPIDGVVLKISAREGERPDIDGVLEVGASQSMEAVIEVYESDIKRVRIGQSVSLISENGGFKGTLYGLVKRISPQVRQRKTLSTDPTGDADARVVQVRVSLDSQSAELVRELTGMKVIARFATL